MAEFREDPSIYPALVALSGCLCNELAASGLPTPCFCGVLPGANVPMAYCGECVAGVSDANGCGGQAWVRLEQVFPSVIFPTPAENTVCNTGLVASIEIGVLRCMQVIEESGEAPSLDEQVRATRLQLADMQAMRRAVLCCDWRADSDLQLLLTSYTPVGPEGGCVGGTWSFMVAV
jgi:hypothetical protein